MYEVADVFNLFMDDYRELYTPSYRQEEVIRAIMACRTPEMGGVVNQCDDCGAVQFVFKSCGDSHCPKCGKFRKAEWVARQKILELPIPYFHVTFTTDHALNVLIPANQKVMLDSIIWAASVTLQKFAQKYLGGQIGFTIVLHTWGQTMIPHVHVHSFDKLRTGASCRAAPCRRMARPFARVEKAICSMPKSYRPNFGIGCAAA